MSEERANGFPRPTLYAQGPELKEAIELGVRGVLTSPHVQPLSPGDPEGGDDTGVVSGPVLRDQDPRALSQHGAGHLSRPRGVGDPVGGGA